MAEAAGSSSKPRKEQAEASSEPPVKRSKPAAAPLLQIRRPGYGKLGRNVRLVTNHFSVTFQPKLTITHYTVTISTADARLLKSPLKRKVVECLRETYDLKEFPFAYDGDQALFVAGDLGFRSKEFLVTLLDRRDGAGPPRTDDDRRRAANEFVVQLDFAAVVDMNAIAAVNRGERDSRAQDALRVLDIMIREHATKKSYVLQRDCFYSQTFGRGSNLGGGVETWKGYHASFRPTQNGLSLNFDTATTLMIKETRVEILVEEYCKKRISSFRDEDYIKCKRLLKGLMVQDYSKRTHKILGFSPQPLSAQMFPMKKKDANGALLEAEDISVADYFTRVKGLTLKAPFQRALDVGRPKKPTYFPMELCTIVPGQRYKKTLTTAQRQGMIKECKLNPDQRVRFIGQMMQRNEYDRNDMVKAFGVRIDDKMTRLDGRVLEPPQLQFGKGVRETPRNGRWNFNIDRQMNRPAATKKWILVWFKNFRALRVTPKKVGDMLMDVASKKGMNFGCFEVLEENDQDHRRMSPLQRVENMIDRLRNKVKNAQGDPVPPEDWPLVVAILPEKSPDLYIPFKKICETKIGIVTQCMVPPNGDVNPKYLSSLSLKINLKLGGYNSVLAGEDSKSLPKISAAQTIIFGLDVSHGSPGDANSPSVAAAVATVEWPRFSRYTCSVRAQGAKTEIIDGLYERKDGGRDTGMVKELLMHYYNKSKEPNNEDRKPKQILVYRDGVSESQFEQVLQKELRAFKNACEALQAGYNPKITFVVVQKKHHTRFFVEANMQNVAPGTVIDRSVCHPRDNDFYLVAHAAIGTSRPTHYHVIWDEIGFNADDLQTITHGLCYTYSRCTSAVSVVAPAYYAHVAAAHCQNLVDTSDSSSESTVQSGAHTRRCVEALPKLHANVLKNMFYA